MNFLGIDIGSVSISIAELNKKKQVVKTSYLFHEGEIEERIRRELKKYDLININNIGITSSTPKIFREAKIVDSRVAFITTAKKLYKNIGSLLIVGGEKFGLALFNEKNEYTNYKSNTSCAAGTGSFLDQQAKRLNLKNIKLFSDLAFKNKDDFPKIASRCAVFAKTDLIHAQQEGYKKEEIADGLSYGLSKNIVDTLFNNTNFLSPVIFAGGVAQNKAVTKHLSKLIGNELLVHEYSHLFGAIGAALKLMEESQPERLRYSGIDDLIIKTQTKKTYPYKPLKLKLSDYPDFTSLKKYEFQSKIFADLSKVEIDIYKDLSKSQPENVRYEKTQPGRLRYINVFLGIDIGSTSTKATIVSQKNEVLIGLYTKTAGQPVTALQTIFEAIDEIQEKNKLEFNFLATGTTGSGRKFIGKIIGADIILDEITAHARAAYEIDNEVDTIIEIGGQDSKFTTLRNGNVTFSKMNNVCAAGTGSFIEEQAKKLGVSLFEYADRAEQSSSPMASDRCTVFMERDLNYYLNDGYKTNELLASVLHSIRENYLSKVAIEGSIGEKIFFQGATAKNRALIAAFEQKLQKPIIVSKFCHLTGAMGVALELSDVSKSSSNLKQSKFKGLSIYKKEIPIKTEICELCTNHCKLKIAEIDGTVEAYGFLCGRDYNVKKFVNNNTSGFNLIKEYNKIFRYKPTAKSDIIIGIPAGLYLHEDLTKWQKFFDLLNIKTINSTNYKEVTQTGKNIAGAEFCAPIAAMHGHVKYLANKSDYIFLPTYLEAEKSQKNHRRLYCYYTQFLPAIIQSNNTLENIKFITPTLYSLQNELVMKFNLHKSLKDARINDYSVFEINNAYEKAYLYHKKLQERWKGLFQKHFNFFKKTKKTQNFIPKLLFRQTETFTTNKKENKQLQVMFLGRPYTILSQAMNNNVPDLFARYGIKTFFQNMLDIDESEAKNISSLLKSIKWDYAAKILTVADRIARTEGLYPVFITSFKCSPDSFALEYFKQLLDSHKKPYLILQLDEHNSNVGYETRIEAAIRSFENHYKTKTIDREKTKGFAKTNFIDSVKGLKNKTLLLPNWDSYSSNLVKASLINAGIDTELLYDTPERIQRSMAMNTGQCIPLNIIVQNAFEFIIDNKIKPEKVAIWAMDTPLSCNFQMYPFYIDNIFKSKSKKFKGLDKVSIYYGQVSFFDISFNTSVNAYLSYMFGGYIKKIGCKLRPYEVNKGETDKLIKESLAHLYETFLHGKDKEKALKIIIEKFKKIKINKGNKPKVAIFGDLYARDNDVFNQDLVHFIEKNGGEVVTTPYNEYYKIISNQYMNRRLKEGFYLGAATLKFFNYIVPMIDNTYFKYFQEILKEPPLKALENYKEKLSRFHLKTTLNGETMDNALKIIHLKEQYPNLALFVQTTPSYCAPGLVTESLISRMEKITGIPAVNIEYDGTSSSKNDDIIPFINYAKK